MSVDDKPWTHGEEGPECWCGNGTNVCCDREKGYKEPGLMCMMHTYEAGQMFALPAEKPSGWDEAPDSFKWFVVGMAVEGAKAARAANA